MTVQFARLQHLDITPGSVSEVKRALSSGQMVAVDHGPHDVARQLADIDSELGLHFDPYEDLWVVMQRRHLPDGSVSENLVTTAKECDGRFVARVREITDPRYDLAAAIEKTEADADRAHEHKRREVLGDAAERLGHALRQDLGRHEAPQTAKSKAFIPRAFRPR